VFEIKLNDYNWKKGRQYYTIQKVFNYNPKFEKLLKLDHITTEALKFIYILWQNRYTIFQFSNSN
jgi:hypothetical protein